MQNRLLTIAESFLVDQGHVNLAKEDLKMALLCIDYLDLPCFTGTPSEARVLNGDYGFMDYAVLNWVRHLEYGAPQVSFDEPLIAELAESLEIFIGHHWKFPTARYVHLLCKFTSALQKK